MTRARETSENARQAKAWVYFNAANGTSSITPTIAASFNVSSIQDYGTGNYGVNFEENMSSTNYVGVVTISADVTSSTNGAYPTIPVVHQAFSTPHFGTGGTNTTTSNFVDKFRFQCSLTSSYAGMRDQTNVYAVFYE